MSTRVRRTASTSMYIFLEARCLKNSLITQTNLNYFIYEMLQIPKDPLPVMVWIHGGGFFAGDGTTDLYGPERILDPGSVILVTVNYRLGSLGFLSMGDDVLPPNLGMLDQTEALKWVHKNIASFGGDPGKVRGHKKEKNAGKLWLFVIR